MAVMQIELAFGKTGITADLPEQFRYRILEARSATPLADWSYETVDSAIAALAAALPPGANVAVIPEGPYVLAKARAHEMVG